MAIAKKQEPDRTSFGIWAILVSIDLLALGIYLYLFRSGIYSQVLIFWACSLIAVILIIFGILLFSRRFQVYFLLFAIIILLWLIKSVYVPIDVPFFGSDPYVTLSATENIAETGWFNNPPWNKDLDIVSAQGQAYPLLSGITIGLSTLTGTSLITVARWVSIILSLVSIMLVFGISYQLYHSEKTALFSALGFGTTYYFLMFHTLYVREALAFTFFLAILYSFLEREKSSGASPLIVPFILVIGLILTHHLTALMLTLFVLSSLILRFLLSWKIKSIDQSVRRNIEWPFLGFLVVAMLTYWIYLRYTPIQIINVMINNAFSDSPTFSLSNIVPNTSRYSATLLFQASSALFLGILAVIGLVKFKTTDYSWQIISVVWGGTLGLIVLVGATGALGSLGVFPSRMEIYGYTFLIPASCHTIVSIFRKVPWAGILIALGTLVLYVSSSLLRTAPYLYSDIQPNYEAGEKRAILQRQEFTLISKVVPEQKGLIGTEFRGPIQLFGIHASFPDSSNLGNLLTYNYLLLTPLDTQLHQIVATAPYYNALDKVYDYGPTELYIPVTMGFTNINTIVRSPSHPVTQTINPQYWFFTILTLLACFITGFLLIDLLGFGLRYARGYSPIGKQALGFCAGIFLLFLGFLLYDVTGHVIPVLIIVPLALAAVSTLINLVSKSKSLHQVSRFLSSWFFIVLIGGVGISSYLFEIASLANIRDPGTEFYISSASQNNLSGTIIIANQGDQNHSYRIEGWLAEKKLLDAQITLPPHQNTEEPFVVDSTYVSAFPNQPIKFILNTDRNITGEEQILYLWPR